MNVFFQGVVLIFFLVVLAAMIWDARKQYHLRRRSRFSKPRDEQSNTRSHESSMAQDFDEVVLIKNQAEVAQSVSTNRFTVLHLMADASTGFGGHAIWEVLHGLGLLYGEKQVFHAYDPAGKGILFSVVSAVNPGIFDLKQLSSFSTPGLTFILMSTEGELALSAFENMLATAQTCATLLQGQLQDEGHAPLSDTVIAWYRQRLQEQNQSRLVG